MRYVIIILSCVCLSMPFQGQAQSSYRDRTPAERYLLSALDFISAESYYRDRIDWDAHYEEMLAELQDAAPDDIEAAYPLIRETLQLLDDDHSFFALPRQVENNFRSTSRNTGIRLTEDIVYLVYPDSPADKAGIQTGDTFVSVDDFNEEGLPESFTLRRPDGDGYSVSIERESFPVTPWTAGITQTFNGCVGYIESHHVASRDLADEYVRVMWQALENLQSESDICGWIVDVRRNGGGWIRPVLMGVAPLIGERDLFQEMYYTVQNMWAYQDEALYYDGRMEWNGPARLNAPDADTSLPLVVLTGSPTGSAGEMVVMAFRERPNTYFIGEETAGAATRGSGRDMNDGAMLYVTVARFADPDGTIYDLSLEPDDVVPVQWDVFGTADDPVIQAALDWIDTARTD
jgi:C-terminal processing protease CtpA/Prc